MSSLALVIRSRAILFVSTNVTRRIMRKATNLNAHRDISVKVISCSQIVNHCLGATTMTTQAATALAELVLCTTMMGANLKGQESLQINIVGEAGLRSITAVSDGDLHVRARVSHPQHEFAPGSISVRSQCLSDISELVCAASGAEGQVQVIRSHPLWRQPVTGLVQLRPTSIADNMALYLSESEQRMAALATSVRVENNRCVHALGVMVERLPAVQQAGDADGGQARSDDYIEAVIANLQRVQRSGLESYLGGRGQVNVCDGDGQSLVSTEKALHRILDDVLRGQLSSPGDDTSAIPSSSNRYSRHPVFRCTCGVERVWRMLGLLPKSEIRFIVEKNDNVEVSCDFCGTCYSVSPQEVTARFLTDTNLV